MDAIYARQSIDKKDSLSVEGQEKLCRKYAGDEVQVFCDRGYSGKNVNRPAFAALMEAVEKGDIQRIIVYRLDRFSRSIADFSQIWTKLKQHGVEFLSVTENFDTSSPMGRAMLNTVLVFAQLERETTAERVKDNYIHRFSLGAWPGGPAPFGFDLAKTEDNGRRVSTLVANDKAEIVKRIFEAYADTDISLRQIARRLTEAGVHGPKREAWDGVTLSRILHSPLYVRANEDIYFHYLAMGMTAQQEAEAFDGAHACNVVGRRDRSGNKYNSLAGQMFTVANHEGFIAPETWLKVQDKLAQNTQLPMAGAGKYSWLTGLLKCGECGYAVKINYAKGEDKFYLICSGHSNLRNCEAVIRVDLRELERMVEEQIVRLLESCPAEEVYPASAAETEQLQIVEQRIERLVQAMAESSEITAAYVSKQIDRLHKERESILAQLQRKKPETTRLDFRSADFEEKKLIAAEFIERIALKDNTVDIIWKV